MRRIRVIGICLAALLFLLILNYLWAVNPTFTPKKSYGATIPGYMVFEVKGNTNPEVVSKKVRIEKGKKFSYTYEFNSRNGLTYFTKVRFKQTIEGDDVYEIESGDSAFGTVDREVTFSGKEMTAYESSCYSLYFIPSIRLNR